MSLVAPAPTPTARHQRLVEICARLLGREVAEIGFPGGPRRDSYRLVLDDGQRVIATRRPDRAQARREVRVLEGLRAHGAPVPEVLAFNGHVLIQSDLGEQRLSQALAAGSPAEVEALLAAALDSLARLQAAGSAAGLEGLLQPLGTVPSPWISGLLARPAVFSKFFGLTCPALPLAFLGELFTVPRPRFVKWDARPANAALGVAGIGWFDFEDCFSRRRLDDVGWLLADEFTPDLPEVEERLLDRWLPVFADDLDVASARLYLAVFRVFHSLVRLGLILAKRKDGPWWDWAYCVENDKAGVTREAATRLCHRASRLAREVPPLVALADWFLSLSASIPENARAA